jgi:hypothetical protein
LPKIVALSQTLHLAIWATSFQNILPSPPAGKNPLAVLGAPGHYNRGLCKMQEKFYGYSLGVFLRNKKTFTLGLTLRIVHGILAY